MSIYHPPVDEHENVIKAALRVIQSTHYQRADDPHADAEQEYAQEQLALAARALVEAVNARPADEQPLGWAKEADPRFPRRIYVDGEGDPWIDHGIKDGVAYIVPLDPASPGNADDAEGIRENTGGLREIGRCA
nr:hypothetical protein OH837_48990 [Streptomyces canus]